MKRKAPPPPSGTLRAPKRGAGAVVEADEHKSGPASASSAADPSHVLVGPTSVRFSTETEIDRALPYLRPLARIDPHQELMLRKETKPGGADGLPLFVRNIIHYRRSDSAWLTGVTKDGSNAAVQVTGFRPYLYIDVPKQGSALEFQELLIAELQRRDVRLPRAGPIASNRKRKRYDNFEQGSGDGPSESFSPSDSKPAVASGVNAPVNLKLVRRKRLLGFYEGEERYKNYLFVDFSSWRIRQAVLKILDEWSKTEGNTVFGGLHTYHTDFTYEKLLGDEIGIRPFQWTFIDLENISAPQRLRRQEGPCTRAQIEFGVNLSAIKKDETNTLQAKQLQVGIDIECQAGKGGDNFPDASVAEDLITTFALQFQWSDQPIAERLIVIQVGTCNRIRKFQDAKETVTISVPDEEHALKAFATIMKKSNWDEFVGYNIHRFDLPYIFERAKLHNLQADFAELSLFHDCQFEDIYRDKQSKADWKSRSGVKQQDVNFEDETSTVAIPGRDTFDVFPVVAKQENLTDYSLKTACKNLLDQNVEKSIHGNANAKLELDYKLLQPYQNGDAYTRGLIAEYCAQDTAVTMRLVRAKKYVLFIQAVCRLTGTPLRDVLVRGEQCKLFNLMCSVLKSKDFIINRQNQWKPKEDRYQGAYVLDPIPGWYMDQEVCCLDFQSLYPSIMVAYKMCYTNVLDDPVKAAELIAKGRILVERKISDKFTVWFVQDEVENIVPSMLTDLLNARAGAKSELKKAKAAGNEYDQNVWDTLQAAFKVLCNSLYGFTGVSALKGGKLSDPRIAASVTAFGREMIEDSKRIAETEFQAKVIYGDTDSIFFRFLDLEEECKGWDPVLRKQRYIDKAKKLADRITKHFGRDPILLVFEKLLTPFLMIRKKKYCGLKWEEAAKPKDILKRGIECVRRDWPLWTRETSYKIIDELMLKRNVNAAVQHIRDAIRWLANFDENNQDDWDKLIISKSVKKKQLLLGAQSKQSHMWVALNKHSRNRSYKVKKGDRVQFVYTLSNNPKAYMNAEDPEYAKQKGIPIDFVSYLHDRFLAPIRRLLELVQDDFLIDLKEEIGLVERRGSGCHALTDLGATLHRSTILRAGQEYAAMAEAPPSTGAGAHMDDENDDSDDDEEDENLRPSRRPPAPASSTASLSSSSGATSSSTASLSSSSSSTSISSSSSNTSAASTSSSSSTDPLARAIAGPAPMEVVEEEDEPPHPPAAPTTAPVVTHKRLPRIMGEMKRSHVKKKADIAKGTKSILGFFRPAVLSTG